MEPDDEAGGPRYLRIRREHRLLPSAHEPRQVWRRDKVDPSLRLTALLRLLPDRRSRHALLPDPRCGGRDSRPSLLDLRECVILAVLAQPDARRDERAARRPARWRVPLQRRNRRTRLPLAKRHSDGAERSDRPRRELHVRLPDPGSRPLATDRAEDLNITDDRLPSRRVRSRR